MPGALSPSTGLDVCLQRMLERTQAPHAAFYALDGRLPSMSPERFLRIEGGGVAQPMKGTRPRSASVLTANWRWNWRVEKGAQREHHGLDDAQRPEPYRLIAPACSPRSCAREDHLPCTRW
jgi:hypothetical protein